MRARGISPPTILQRRQGWPYPCGDRQCCEQTLEHAERRRRPRAAPTRTLSQRRRRPSVMPQVQKPPDQLACPDADQVAFK